MIVEKPIVAVSPGMRTALGRVEKVARYDCTVLIMGESGVGKELVAERIHRLSPRCQKPFVVVNCGAIPENLVESELFGYEPGAFTGAGTAGKPGLIEMADGGTLFLDEVSELPLTMQVKLLRVLQDFRVQRVGGVRPRLVDVRLLAATNRSLFRMAEEGRFRWDLLYRINAAAIHLPPLRERPEDLEPAADLFLGEYNRRYGLNRRITPELLAAFRRYHWPGNLRQLNHTVERLAILSDGDDLGPELLPNYMLRGEPAPAAGVTVLRLMPLPDAETELERQLLILALEHHSSTRDLAGALGISQPQVVRKLKRHGLKASGRG